MIDNRSYQQLKLNISSGGRILNVTVYPDRAEVTRLFDLQLDAGKTAVTFTGGFPYVKAMPVFSRLEKEGDVTLHDVEIIEAKPADSSSQTPEPVLHALEEEKELLKASLLRCELAPTLLDQYMKELDLQKIPINMLGEFLETYDKQSYKWDKRAQELKKKVRDVEDKIKEAQNPVPDSTSAQAENIFFSNHQVQCTLETNGTVSVEVRLVYFVMEASWMAEYEITVTSACSEDEEMDLNLVYKAVITNNSAEIWENANIELESAPFVNQKQKLPPWRLVFNDCEGTNSSSIAIPNFTHIFADKVHIPRESKRAITIAQLQPQVLFERYCTPSVDYRVRVEGKITNSTEYPFCAGNAKIYIDGNYYADNLLDAIPAGEVWSVPLGFDDKIHVVYSPFTKTTAEKVATFANMGRLDHTLTHDRHRRMTVRNMRRVTIFSLIVIDNYATSEVEDEIASKLVVPPLQKGNNSPVTLVDGIPRDSHVVARWDRIQHRVHKPEDVGTFGLVNWECKIGPLREIDLDFRWTVIVKNGLGHIKGFQ